MNRPTNSYASTKSRSSATRDRSYFAAEPFKQEDPDTRIGKRLVTKVEEYDSNELVRRVDQRLALAYRHYFGYSPEGFHATSIVARGGDQGELSEIRVNHARALVNALLNLIVKDRFVWQPRASNYSYESVRQTELAQNVLEHYWQNHGVKAFCDSAVEQAIAFTEGYVLLEWDEAAGPIFGPDPANPSGFIRTGDLRYSNVSAWDVIRDPWARSWDDLLWLIVRVTRNRFDLAARIHANPNITPEDKEALTERVYAVDNVPEHGRNKPGQARDWESDNIPVFIFYHKPNAILPLGRETHFLADGTVLKDEGLVLERFPLFRVAPAETIGTPFGYSPFYEILGIQEMADAVYTALATNISTFACQNIIVEEGVNVQPDDLAGGMKVIYRPAGSEKAIEPLQLTRSPPEAFAFVKDLKAHQELLMGLNETVRGQIQSDRMSGSAMALLDTQALRQASTLAGAYVKMVQELGSATLRFIRLKASLPLKISMVGKSKMSLIRETSLTGDMLSNIDQVFVDVGNPMLQNASGRFDLATQMLQMGVLTTPEQVTEVLETGRLESVTHAEREQLRNIMRENEQITEGKKPIVLIHDDHLLHGREHTTPVSSPESRENPQVIKAYMEHMHGHYLNFFGTPPGEYMLDPMTGQERFQQTDPLYRERMLILSGQQPPPPMAPPGMLGPMPGPTGEPGPEGEGAPPASAPSGPSEAPPTQGPSAEPPANLPKPPVNPATGSRWNPADGGTGGGPVPNA